MNFNLPADPKAMGASFDWVKQLECALTGDHPALRRGNVPLEITLPPGQVARCGKAERTSIANQRQQSR
jgi:hypothetical protein